MPGVICVKPFSGVRNAAVRPLRGITQARRTVCVKAKTEGLTEAAKSIAAAGVAATWMAAGQAQAATELAQIAASDNRFGTISLLLVPVLGWVLFNILGPTVNQIDRMSKKGIAAALGITGASLLAAQSSDAAEQVATLAASDNRFGTISLLLVPVLGWVLFNIFSPTKNQIDNMSKKGVAATIGITGASLLAAQSADAAEQVGTLAASDNRFGTISLLLVPVLGWVLFNIFSPTKNQIDNMSKKGVAATIGITGASLLAAQSADAAEQVGTLAASDNRFGTISLLLVPVLGWVLFNIFGPTKNQIDNMSKKGVAAAAGITGASLLTAQSSDAAEQIAALAASDNRFGVITLLFLPVVGWVLFNILGPTKNQIDNMAQK